MNAEGIEEHALYTEASDVSLERFTSVTANMKHYTTAKKQKILNHSAIHHFPYTL